MTDFNIIIFGDHEAEFYIIPYIAMKHLLHSSTLQTDRWIGSITNHQLSIRRSEHTIDIAQYYGNVYLITKQAVPPNEENEYAIHNRKAEIEVRQKQSIFRKEVLRNFDTTCCISGIKEDTLLVAGHIVPWSHQISCRLDPANGICLSLLYDKLFDKGYITLSDSLHIIITSHYAGFDKALQEMLVTIDGKNIKRPKLPIKQEYLLYHQQHIFMG